MNEKFIETAVRAEVERLVAAETVKVIDEEHAPEVFVRELAREIRVNLIHGFGK